MCKMLEPQHLESGKQRLLLCEKQVLIAWEWVKWHLSNRYRRSPKLPRKEVIQPHLPVRLPCYDFTPITDPTLDACLPTGLAQRLQV